ncbi:hypothetical protein BC827DRAFT_207360 [Russula dissimulans]|nr:hypothetical protein BC827DRAFT_207360 [Russula dissimulans]
MLHNVPDKEIDDLLRVYYPDDQRAGSPFDTGFLNVLSPQFKRTAVVQTDFVFHGPRRFLLKNRAHIQNSWAFSFSFSLVSCTIPCVTTYYTVMTPSSSFSMCPFLFILFYV